MGGYLSSSKARQRQRDSRESRRLQRLNQKLSVPLAQHGGNEKQRRDRPQARRPHPEDRRQYLRQAARVRARPAARRGCAIRRESRTRARSKCMACISLIFRTTNCRVAGATNLARPILICGFPLVVARPNPWVVNAGVGETTRGRRCRRSLSASERAHGTSVVYWEQAHLHSRVELSGAERSPEALAHSDSKSYGAGCCVPS